MNEEICNHYAPEVADILAFNRRFVDNKAYEPYATSKFPDKKLAIVACMDTRLSTLLLAALGLKNGDAKVIKNAGGLVAAPFDSAMRSLLVGIYELGVEHIMVVAHSDCGACHLSGRHMRELMIQRGISERAIAATESSEGISVEQWLEGFHDTEAAVRRSVDMIRQHPLVPADVHVYGFIIDTHTGLLTAVPCAR